MSDVTPEALEQAVDTLSKLEAGWLPLPLFLQISRLSVSAIVELVPLRQSVQGLETLLLRRPADDPNWPNQWANPGTVLRPTDESIGQVFQRLCEDELNGVEFAKEPTFAGPLLFATSRGRHSAHVYWVELPDFETGEYFPVDNLPSEFVRNMDPAVSGQADVIGLAAQHFRKFVRG